MKVSLEKTKMMVAYVDLKKLKRARLTHVVCVGSELQQIWFCVRNATGGFMQDVQLRI